VHGFVMPLHLVYFIRAKRYPWVKVGMSRDEMTLDRRLTTIAGREPFDVVLVGVSSVISEAQAHADLSQHHIRSEWFKWCKPVSEYVKGQSNVYHRRKDGDDGWFGIVDDILVAEHNAKSEEISKAIRGLRT
jgi:hypothetical protein